jgi:hypothetical protein
MATTLLHGLKIQVEGLATGDCQARRKTRPRRADAEVAGTVAGARVTQAAALRAVSRPSPSTANPILAAALRSILRGNTPLPSLAEMGVRPEILEAAAEIADSSDVLGIETGPHEFLVRVVIWTDRQFGQRDSDRN